MHMQIRHYGSRHRCQSEVLDNDRVGTVSDCCAGTLPVTRRSE